MLVAAFSVAHFSLAQTDFGIGAGSVGDNLNLSATDPTLIITRIINIALGFLGLIAVVLIIYGGFVWMTSGGAADKVDQAKRILKNAIIGLVIIISSWGIVSFVIGKLIDATGGVNDNNYHGVNTSSLVGTGAIGACSVESVYPEDNQKDLARNTSIMLTFKEAVRLDSVCQNVNGGDCDCDNTAACNLINPNNIRIFQAEVGDSCETSACSANVQAATVNVSSDYKTLVIKPTNPLGSSEGNTDYQVKLTNDIWKAESDESMFSNCYADWLEWGFQVSDILDLTPPQVVRGKIFPLPDNEADNVGQLTAAVTSTAIIKVLDQPNTYQAAISTGTDINVGNYAITSVVMDATYHYNFTTITVISTQDDSQAQIFAGSSLLGVAAWDNNQINFPGFFQLTVEDHVAGSSWQVHIQPEVLADQLVVGNEVYTFANNGSNNNILVTDTSDPASIADNIRQELSGHGDVNISVSGAQVTLTAKVAGSAGNNINLTTTNNTAISLQPFSGGSDLSYSNEINGQQDRPMNSVIQFNFNEAVNPLYVSGPAQDDNEYLQVQVVNADSGAVGSNAVCEQDSDCLSYKCENNLCDGNYLAGKFTIANAYKTVEFTSDVECGQNACGEKIYCLPADSHLAVKLLAANLKTCSSNDDCSAFQPFSNCNVSSDLSQKVCQDSNGNNYPAASLSPAVDGIIDTSLNSFDGNRNVYADGPVSFYNENEDAVANANLKDNYVWSFYISDQIMLTAPQIASINPVINATSIDIKKPIQIKFNTLMMNSSLRTGSVIINNGKQDFDHHLLNIFSAVPTPLGYWVTADNRDDNPLDGVPDTTFAFLNHTELIPSAAYKTQVGSGVKDIYQNCFKPSIGPNCSADEANPSCCNGTVTSTLNIEDGNCE